MAIITFMITLSIYVLCSVVLQFLLASETARNILGLALANCVVSGTETEALSREQLEKCRVMEALSTDSSLRWAISLLIGAILTSSPQSSLESMQLTNVDPLLVQLPMDHEWSMLARSFSLLNFWVWFLAALGWKTWFRTGWGQALFVALLPSIVIYGVMALFAII